MSNNTYTVKSKRSPNSLTRSQINRLMQQVRSGPPPSVNPTKSKNPSKIKEKSKSKKQNPDFLSDLFAALIAPFSKSTVSTAFIFSLLLTATSIWLHYSSDGESWLSNLAKSFQNSPSFKPIGDFIINYTGKIIGVLMCIPTAISAPRFIVDGGNKFKTPPSFAIFSIMAILVLWSREMPPVVYLLLTGGALIIMYLKLTIHRVVTAIMLLLIYFMYFSTNATTPSTTTPISSSSTPSSKT